MALTEQMIRVQKDNHHKKGIYLYQRRLYNKYGKRIPSAYIFIEAPQALKK